MRITDHLKYFYGEEQNFYLFDTGASTYLYGPCLLRWLGRDTAATNLVQSNTSTCLLKSLYSDAMTTRTSLTIPTQPLIPVACLLGSTICEGITELSRMASTWFSKVTGPTGFNAQAPTTLVRRWVFGLIGLTTTSVLLSLLLTCTAYHSFSNL
ncbi:hypothetical protein DL96DRAFT_1718981 [Flagelloscypha sp. PMI_526]|nr:hypothetical protein DL96DRAFT_1718981 [Flagelloscypha sp. PMI_526]